MRRILQISRFSFTTGDTGKFATFDRSLQD